MWALRRLEIGLLQCALCLCLSAQICDSVPQRRELSNRNTATGCLHNNTMFADTSIIPSSEPCLLCKCSSKNLVCVRRVCKDQPYPPPRSCILVQKKSLCCPYLSCSKYHINYYKNSERNREHMNRVDVNHEKTLEKSSRTDDGEEETNGGCIESGSLYASGSAMVRSSSSLCSYCYCINGQQKCIKPKCLLQDTKCKPIFMDASCCPVKYDCSFNSTAKTPSQHDENNFNRNHLSVRRKNRSKGCFESGKYYQEGEKLPSGEKRPCEMCYCIKGFRKCVMKKCAPLIKGCIPKVPKEGNCCPTSYDCSRSLKVTRQTRQSNGEEPEEDPDGSIDFFSLLFGSDEPQEEISTENANVIQTTTLQPFKALPSTEKSFFDLLRAGLEIIDANADTIDTQLNVVVTTPRNLQRERDAIADDVNTTTLNSNLKLQTSTEKLAETTQRRTTLVTQSSYKPEASSTTIKLPEKLLTSSVASTTSSAPKLMTTVKTSSTTPSAVTTVKISTTSGLQKRTEGTTRLKVSSTTISPSTKTKTTSSPTKTTTAQTTRKLLPPSTKRATTERLRETTPKVLIETTISPSTARTTSKFMTTTMTTTTEGHHKHGGFFDDVIRSDIKIIDSDDNEAETIPNIEIIPFVAHDAIDTDKFEPYLKPYDNLEKDYFANDKQEKPFRYNNKFTHHSYDDSADYVYTNPHERIDNGPYYFESNDNQFDSFSPPSEQDFLGGFSPKESIYDEVSTIASHELPLRNNEFIQKPLDALKIHEHKSNVTSTEKTLTLPINQTTHASDKAEQHDVIPGFKKISSNFTSFIDDLLHGNVLEEATTTTTKASTSTTSAPTSTSKPIKSIINDDDFIIKHLNTPTAAAAVVAKKTTQGVTEIFSKPTTPTMNGLLKLAGCNIYGQMYNVGELIAELSNACLECKCLPDIGVGCNPKC